MALKPRKQRKHYPYLFLLDEKSFLKYLKGQYVKYQNYSDYGYSDSNYYPEGLIFSETKLIIRPQEHRFSALERLLDLLTEDGKLEYAPIFCSSWITTGDKKAISLMLQAQEASLKKRNKPRSSKNKREERKSLRNELYIIGFESTADTPHLPLSNRDYKWWLKGYNDGKLDDSVFLYYDLLFTEEDIEQLSKCKGDN